jgi:hypothetical protein
MKTNKYNSGSFVSPEKSVRIKILLFACVAIFFSVAIIGILYALDYLHIYNFDIQFVFSITAILISIFAVVLPLLDKSLNNTHSSKKAISISVSVMQNHVICSGSIANLTDHRITNKNIYLVISKGKKSDSGEYEFGLKIQHEKPNGENTCDVKEEAYCIYSKIMHICNIDCDSSICSDNKKSLINDNIINETADPNEKATLRRFNENVSNEYYHRIFVFQALSPKSRIFLDSGEEYSDSIVVGDLEPGVYRALMIWIPDENVHHNKEDCACALEYFIVE